MLNLVKWWTVAIVGVATLYALIVDLMFGIAWIYKLCGGTV